MMLIRITVLLIAVLGINHLVHGFGCWGFQPGGRASATIYDLQIVTAAIGVLWLLTALARRTVPCDPLRIRAIALLVFASVATYMRFGWAAHTSIHHQGAENLVAFLTVAATTYLVGRYGSLRTENSEPSRVL